MQQNTEIKEIVATNLLDYSIQAQVLIKQGYVFSDRNEHCPQAIGYAFYAWLVKDTAEIPSDTSTKPVEAFSEANQGVDSQEENKSIVEGMRSTPDEVEPTKGLPQGNRKGRSKKV